MASVTYGWNPFQERIDCNIKGEVIKPASSSNRRVFVPRAAPFFSRNAVLRIVGSTTPLNIGEDFFFQNSFDRFINKYTRNCYGAVVLRKDFGDQPIEMDYSTIGGSMVLDEVAFAELVANIVNAPRLADWSDLVDVPTEWDPDPHEQPATQTYDYLELITQIKSLVSAVTQTSAGSSFDELLMQHLDASLSKAHSATSADVGLSLTPNMSAATIADLNGNSGNKLVTIDVMKEAFRQMAANTLPL